MTTATLPGISTRTPRPGFAQSLRSEWSKLTTVRSTYIEAILAVGLGLLLTATLALALAIDTSFSDLSAQDRATFDPADITSFGAAFAVIVLVVLGVTFASLNTPAA